MIHGSTFTLVNQRFDLVLFFPSIAMDLVTLVVLFFPNWMCSAMPARHRKISSKSQHELNDVRAEDLSDVDVNNRSEKDTSLMSNRSLLQPFAGVHGVREEDKNDVCNAIML